jgi:hypothetical protein
MKIKINTKDMSALERVRYIIRKEYLYCFVYLFPEMLTLLLVQTLVLVVGVGIIIGGL